MRSILTLTILALALAGCGGSSHPIRPSFDPSVALAGDDFRNGVVTHTSGTLIGEPDQTIQFSGSAVRFHVTTLGVDIAGLNGQEFTVGGNTYHLLVYKNSAVSAPNGVVALQGDAGSVMWDTNVPLGSG